MSDDEAPPAEENEDAANEGAESFDGEEGGEEEEGGKNKLIIIIAGVILLLVGGGAGAYFSGALDGLLGKGDAAEESHDEDGGEHDDGHGKKDDSHGKKDDGHGKKAKKAKKSKKGGDDHGEEGEYGGGSSFLEIPTMIVNLNTSNSTPRYLRLTVQLEMNDPSDVPAVEAIIPRVVDQFQTYLRELRVRDLRGSAGIYRLQTELLWRVNQAAAPTEVKDVLFQEILIQ